MFILHSLNFLLDGRNADDRPLSYKGSSERTNVPEGQLTSAAWEGWWYEAAA
jgi:hypothetical protein